MTCYTRVETISLHLYRAYLSQSLEAPVLFLILSSSTFCVVSAPLPVWILLDFSVAMESPTPDKTMRKGTVHVEDGHDSESKKLSATHQGAENSKAARQSTTPSERGKNGRNGRLENLEECVAVSQLGRTLTPFNVHVPHHASTSEYSGLSSTSFTHSGHGLAAPWMVVLPASAASRASKKCTWPLPPANNCAAICTRAFCVV